MEGSQVTSHAIGSVAIDVLIDAYKTVLKEFGDVSNTLRHRIDHFEFPTKDAINKAIKELNLIVVPHLDSIGSTQITREWILIKNTLTLKCNNVTRIP